MDLNLKIRLPHEQPLPPWRRMSRYVHSRALEHPILQELRARGERPLVNAHEAAIWISCCAQIDAGGWNVSARIERAEWWKPTTRAHGDELLQELAEELESAVAAYRFTTPG